MSRMKDAAERERDERMDERELRTCADDDSGGGDEDEHEMEAAADLEARMTTLASRVVELEEDLRAAKAALEGREREAALDEAASSSGARDPETVRVLLAEAMRGSPGESVEALLADLRDRKPALFRREGAPASALSARVGPAAPAGIDAARRAAAEGDRASLLKYLRLRREQA